MRKFYREMWHYLILTFILTIGIFTAHALSSGLEKMIMSGNIFEMIAGYVLLFLWYAFFIAILLIPVDLVLHKLMKI